MVREVCLLYLKTDHRACALRNHRRLHGRTLWGGLKGSGGLTAPHIGRTRTESVSNLLSLPPHTPAAPSFIIPSVFPWFGASSERRDARSIPGRASRLMMVFRRLRYYEGGLAGEKWFLFSLFFCLFPSLICLNYIRM